jgi:hypothetical protein
VRPPRLQNAGCILSAGDRKLSHDVGVVLIFDHCNFFRIPIWKGQPRRNYSGHDQLYRRFAASILRLRFDNGSYPFATLASARNKLQDADYSVLHLEVIFRLPCILHASCINGICLTLTTLFMTLRFRLSSLVGR